MQHLENCLLWQLKLTYCDENGCGDPENILEYFTPKNSNTLSGWCLDLGDNMLRLTDYTFYKTLSSLVGFVMTMIGVYLTGMIKLIGGRGPSHKRCQATVKWHTKQKRVV